MESLLKSTTLACIKAGLLNKNESGHFQFVLQNRNLKYSEYYKQAKKHLFADAISLYVMSCIIPQGIVVIHSNGTWTSIMSENINDCCLHLVYVSDGLKTHGTFSQLNAYPWMIYFTQNTLITHNKRRQQQGVLPVKDVKLKLLLQVSLARKLLPRNLLLILS